MDKFLEGISWLIRWDATVEDAMEVVRNDRKGASRCSEEDKVKCVAIRARHGHSEGSGIGSGLPELYGPPIHILSLPENSRCVVFHATYDHLFGSIMDRGLLPGGLQQHRRAAVYMTLDYADARSIRPDVDLVIHLDLRAFIAAG
jgi:RNA:NAD 2'-phosphotransferase (TPT1/KptA family)